MTDEAEPLNEEEWEVIHNIMIDVGIKAYKSLHLIHPDNKTLDKEIEAHLRKAIEDK